MAYVQHEWNVGDVITEANMDHLETQYDEADAELTTHEVLDTGVHGAGGSTLATIADFDTIITPWYGDMSDGDVTIAGVTSLTRDMYYENLIVNAVLTTDGFRIFAKTVDNNSTIERNGNDAVTNVQGAALADGSLGGSLIGADGEAESGSGGSGGGVLLLVSPTIDNTGGTISANGGDGGDATGVGGSQVGVAGGATAPSLGGSGGAGGTGSGAVAGGAGGVCTDPTAVMGGFRATPQATLMHEPDGTKLIGGGPGGTGGRNVAGSGGGGGGGGGTVVLIYNTLTAGTEEATGGAGGTEWTGGTVGVAGSVGTVYKISV